MPDVPSPNSLSRVEVGQAAKIRSWLRDLEQPNADPNAIAARALREESLGRDVSTVGNTTLAFLDQTVRLAALDLRMTVSEFLEHARVAQQALSSRDWEANSPGIVSEVFRTYHRLAAVSAGEDAAESEQLISLPPSMSGRAVLLTAQLEEFLRLWQRTAAKSDPNFVLSHDEKLQLLAACEALLSLLRHDCIDTGVAKRSSRALRKVVAACGALVLAVGGGAAGAVATKLTEEAISQTCEIKSKAEEADQQIAEILTLLAEDHARGGNMPSATSSVPRPSE